ncbi:MAG: DUF4131 domain-containing protein [Planctomycetes bacterium]|nr:DUF4131 domain-containing protein [Planctomycetota bacterium]
MFDYNHLAPIKPTPTPLFPVVLAVITGIIIARYHLLNSLSLCVISAAVLIISAIILFRPARLDVKPKHLLPFILICLGFAALAALRYHLIYSYFPPNHIVWCSSDQQRLATIRGAIVTEPYITKSTGSFANFDPMHQPRTIFTIRCTEVLSPTGWIDASGLIYVVVSRPAPHLRYGQQTQIDCWIKNRTGPNNPGTVNRLDYYHAARNLVAAYVNYPEAVTIVSPSNDQISLISRARRTLQNFAYAAVIDDTFHEAANSSPNNDSEAFLMALLLGQRHKLSTQLNENFARTGTLHYLSLSGFHVGLWSGFVWALASLLRLPRFYRGLFTLAALLAFMLIVPPRAPILRAAIISAIFCLAYMTRRTPSNLNLVCFAAIILLLWRPLDLFSPGFQLSFIVVIGIIIFADAGARRKLIRLPNQLDKIAIEPHDEVPWWKYLYQKTAKFIIALFSVAIVAWLVGLPLIAYHFNRFTPYAILGSVCLFPLISLTLLLGFTKLLLTGLFPVVGFILAPPLHYLSQATIFTTQSLAQLPAANINTVSPPLWFIAFFYLLLIHAAFSVKRGYPIARPTILAIGTWIFAFFILLPFNANRNQTRLDLIAVGHGCAAIVQLPDGKVICYDAGSMSNFNAGQYTLTPYLRSYGITRIDAVFISHSNLDHYNALPELCQNFKVAAIYTTEYFPQEPSRATQYLIENINELNIPVKTLSPGPFTFPDHTPSADTYQIEVLWPLDQNLTGPIDTNDSSLVLRIDSDNGSILLCGDIEKHPQRKLIDSLPKNKLNADILLLPHHGSASSTLPEFINTINPKLSLASNNATQQKSLETLQNKLPQRNFLSTFNHGAITTTLTKNGIQIDTFHDKE